MTERDLDPYLNGQGDGTNSPVAPTMALIAVGADRLVQRLADGGWPWPPFERVEAPPCAVRVDVSASDTIDGLPRTLWCDRPAGHTDDPDEPRHRAVIDLDSGSTASWGGQA